MSPDNEKRGKTDPDHHDDKPHSTAGPLGIGGDLLRARDYSREVCPNDG